MLDNDYSNLYQSDYYRKEVESFRTNNDAEGLSNFEQRFSLANALYTEGRKCLAFTSNIPENASIVVVGESEVINSILSEEQSAFEILRDVEEFEKIAHPSKRVAAISATVWACSKHLEKVQQTNTGVHK